MKNKPTFLALIFLVFSIPAVINSQNTALHFDGNMDNLYVALNPPLGNSDFTMETWFYTDLDSTNSCDNWDCLGKYRRLMTLAGPDFNGESSRYEIGTCQGLFTVLFRPSPMCNTILVSPPDGLCIRDREWHHLAMVKSGMDIRLYLDCVEVYTNGTTCSDLPANVTSFSVANWGGPPALNQTWSGAVDETRVWNRALSQAEIDASKHCRPFSWDDNLIVWYDYEDGVIDGDNTSLMHVIDKSSYHNDAYINNLALIGTQSNFVASDAIIAESIFEGLQVEVQAYPTGPSIHEICDGDPVHMSTFGGGSSPPNGASIGTIEWEVDDGSGWLPALNPPYIGWNFPITKGYFSADCSSNQNGFKDIQIRARAISAMDTNSGGPCEVISPPYELRICCPITTATIDVMPDTPICAGLIQTFDVQLHSADPFIQNLGGNASIDWHYSLNGSNVPLTNSADQLVLSQTIDLSQITKPTTVCFYAKLGNCTKSKSFSKCLTVDPPPICGVLRSISTDLIEISSSPHTIYELCPFNDAILQFSGDANCKKRWQYRFDGGQWTDEGSFSNPQLNTNTLPWDFFWQNGAEKIFYRVVCEPISANSGCQPKICDSIEIRLVSTPNHPIISNTSTILCQDDFPYTFSVLNPLNFGSYEWYHDGLLVGTGTSLTTNKPGCFKVNWLGQCTSLLSEKVCIEQCDIIANISCPVNDTCVCIMEEITLNALECTSSCESSSFIYAWTIDGIPGGSSDQITHTPQTSGSTYNLTVTDTYSGCSDTVSRTIIPCDK